MGNADKKARAMKECAEWNTAHPIGTRVIVQNGMRSFVSKTTAAATSFNAGEAVVWVEGLTYSVLLSKVRAA